MTPNRPTATDTLPPAWLVALAGQLAFGLLLIGVLAGAASADEPALADFLKTLDLRGYPSRTAPPQFSAAQSTPGSCY